MAAKIEQGLKAQIHLDPARHIDVIIVCAESADPGKFSIAGVRKLMNGIYAAHLSGNEILKLAEHDQVLSIEQDTETHIQ